MKLLQILALIKKAQSFASGFKTVVAAVGMVALGVYLVTQGQYENGVSQIMLGLAAFGLRAAVDNAVAPVKPDEPADGTKVL